MIRRFCMLPVIAAGLFPSLASAQFGDPGFGGQGAPDPYAVQPGEEGGLPPNAMGQVLDVRRRLAAEPSAREAAFAALRHFRITTNRLDRLRDQARRRAWMPSLNASYRVNDGETITDREQSPSPLFEDTLALNNTQDITVGLNWQLQEQVYSPQTVEIYQLVGVQRDIMLEVLRAYFARKQMLLTLLLAPPEDPLALGSLLFRIEEFESVLDLLTNGWYGDQLDELDPPSPLLQRHFPEVEGRASSEPSDRSEGRER